MKNTYFSKKLPDIRFKAIKWKTPMIFILGLIVLAVVAGGISSVRSKGQSEGGLHNGLAVTGGKTQGGGAVMKVVVDAGQAQTTQQGEGQTGQESPDSAANNQPSGQSETQAQAQSGSSASEGFFVDYRLNREKTREESADMLTPLRSSDDESVRQDAETKWLALNTKNQQEDEIENLLKLRGFSENVVNVQPASVTVIVMADNLSASDLKVIQDTVVRVCKIKLDQIEITTK